MPSLGLCVVRSSAFLLAACFAASASATGPIHPIALTGVDGPLGTGIPGVQFSSFGLAGLPNSGPALTGTRYISFAATLSGPSVTAADNEALVVIRGGGTQLLARKGSQAAGLGAGVNYASFVSESALSDTGKAAFLGTVSGSGVSNFNNDCFWAEPPTGGPLNIAIRENITLAPGTPGVLFGDQANPGHPSTTMWGLYNPTMSNNGTVVQRAGISSPGNGPQWGIWYNPAGPLSDFFLNCQDLPGATPSKTLCGAAAWVINASGAILLSHSSSTTGHGLWSTRALDGSGFGAPGVGPLQNIVHQGQLAPGTGSNWAEFERWSMNRNGRIAFSAAFPDVPLSGGGIWSDGRFGVIQAVALTGGAAPGSAGSFHLHGVSLVNSILIADNNSLTFHGKLWQSGLVGPSNDEGLWSNRALSGPDPVGVLRKVFVESDPVPSGLGPEWSGGITFMNPISYWVNATGRSVFFVNHNDFTRALWMEQPDGSLTPIVKEFTNFDVFGDGSDIRLITGIFPSGTATTGDGHRTIFNDDGDIVFRLTFAGGSEGIFTTAAPPSAPCPADFNNSGGVSVQDIFDFLAAYFSNNLAADFNHSGAVSVQDIFDFLSAYFTGC